MTGQVLVTDDGAVRTIRMNRPDKKNALTSVMYDAMAEAIETAGGSSGIGSILIAGVPGAFCAGNDLQDFLKAAMGGEGLGGAGVRLLFAPARPGRALGAGRAGGAGRLGPPQMVYFGHPGAAGDARG